MNIYVIPFNYTGVKNCLEIRGLSSFLYERIFDSKAPLDQYLLAPEDIQKIQEYLKQSHDQVVNLNLISFVEECLSFKGDQDVAVLIELTLLEQIQTLPITLVHNVIFNTQEKNIINGYLNIPA
jgi:hypothetical protein